MSDKFPNTKRLVVQALMKQHRNLKPKSRCFGSRLTRHRLRVAQKCHCEFNLAAVISSPTD
jgi:hypothetical protein